MDLWHLGQFCLALAVLMWSADKLVHGAVWASVRLGMPTVLAGFTLVALSTSIPELVVCLDAGLRGADGLAVGNIVGSNIANTLLVLSVPALFVPLVIADRYVVGDFAIMATAMLLFAGLAVVGGEFSRVDGIILLLALGVLSFTFYKLIVLRAGAGFVSRGALTQAADDTTHVSTTKNILFIGGGMLLVPLSADLAVDSGLELARDLGVGEELIGLFAVAVGTSLPELATSITAARRQEITLAVGNVVGSNFFNSLLIAGVTATAVPLAVPPRILHIDLWVMLVAILALTPLLLKRQRVGWIWGATMLAVYAAYTVHAWRS